MLLPFMMQCATRSTVGYEQGGRMSTARAGLPEDRADHPECEVRAALEGMAEAWDRLANQKRTL